MIASLIGAAFALGAYLGNQRGWFDRNTITYNVLNLATGVVLTTVAAFDGRIGFIVLNVVWTSPPCRRAARASPRGASRPAEDSGRTYDPHLGLVTVTDEAALCRWLGAQRIEPSELLTTEGKGGPPPRDQGGARTTRSGSGSPGVGKARGAQARHGALARRDPSHGASGPP